MLQQNIFLHVILLPHPFTGLFWATVCKTVRPMLSDHCLSVCLSCLSVTLVCGGQTVGWIKMKLDMQVGLGPGHTVLDGDPASPPQKGGAAHQFSAHICCGQMAGRIKMPHGREVGLSAGNFCVRWRLSSPSPKRGRAPNFWPTSIVAKWLDGSRYHLVQR